MYWYRQGGSVKCKQIDIYIYVYHIDRYISYIDKYDKSILVAS